MDDFCYYFAIQILLHDFTIERPEEPIDLRKENFDAERQNPVQQMKRIPKGKPLKTKNLCMTQFITLTIDTFAVDHRTTDFML